MPPPLVPTLLAAAALGAIWAVLVLSEACSRRRFGAIERVWRGYASGKGMRVTPFAALSGVPSDVGPPMVQGEVQGVAVDLTIQSATMPLTRVEATLPGVSAGFVMAVRRRSLLAVRGGGPSLEEAPTGNKVFDAAFALLSNEPDLARSLLDRRLAQVVGGFPRRFVQLSARGNRLVLTWRGMETDPAVLDAAIEVVFTACRRRA
jgi:hypothetical protein